MIVLPEVAVAVDDLTREIEASTDKTMVTTVDNSVEDESPVKVKRNSRISLNTDESAILTHVNCNDVQEVSNYSSPVKCSAALEENVSNSIIDNSPIEDSPIKARRKNCKSLFDEDDDSFIINNELENGSIEKDWDSEENPQTITDNSIDASPLKQKRKKCKNLFEDDDSSFAEVSMTEFKQTSESLSPVKTGEFRNINENKEPCSESENHEIEVNETNVNENISYNDSEKNDEEEFDDEAFKNDFNNEASCKKDKKSYLREIKGKELMKQSLSLPYFQLPKPDFKSYIDETDKRLSKIILDITPNPNKRTKLKVANLKPDNIVDHFEKPNVAIVLDSTQDQNKTDNCKITLKPVNNIVFEIGSGVDPVESFRKKVMDKMRKCESSKPKTDEKTSKGCTENVSKPIGVERVSWKMKLLKEIAKKKEEALKKKNEMLEELLEEENQSTIDSENEEIIEDDAVDVDLTNNDSFIPPPQKNNFNVSFSEMSKGVHQDNSGTIFSDSLNKDWEMEKDIESSPLCFSLPSFQPGGGFNKLADVSSLSVSYASQVNKSINEFVSHSESPNTSVFDTSNLEIMDRLSSASQNDVKVYDKVLMKENLLAHDHNISQEMTADIMDICSGQFMDEEAPKTPPLISISGDEESEGEDGENSCLSNYSKTLPLKAISVDEDSDIEVYENNCPNDHSVSESDSNDDDLRFKRKILKKRIRPISPIDEESRHGKEDTQVHPSSELLVPNTNLDFSKKLPSSPIEKNSDSENEDHFATEAHNTLVNNFDESSMNEQDHTPKEIQQKPKIFDFFDEEAELSGEECSSDEDEKELDEEEALLIDNSLSEEEESKDQIGTLHLKHLLDDDDQMIRKVKNHFLDEGELYSDAARQRKFNWTFNQTDAEDKDILHESDNEEDANDSPFQQDKLKWMQDNVNEDIVEEAEPLDSTLKINIRKRISTQIVVEGITRSANKRPRNSFLEEDESKKSFKKMKLDITNAQGSRVTKNFVFVETNNKANKKKVTFNKSIVDSSVFDLI